MWFAAGLVIGLAAGAALVLLLGHARRGQLEAHTTLAIGLAVVALVLSIVAVARSRSDTSTAPNDATRSTVAASPPAGTAFTAPATVPATSTTLLVSTPNVIGLSRDAAITLLTGQGLRPDVESEVLTNVPAGFVVSQSPLGGTEVPLGSTVVITVSSSA